MRHWKLTFAGLLLCICTYGQEISDIKERKRGLIGFNPAAAIVQGNVEIHIAHEFSGHWSVNGMASVRLSGLKRENNEEELEHYNEFGHITTVDCPADDGAGIFTGLLAAYYWPQHCFEGPFLSLGGKFSDNGKADLRIGAGYMIRIWKNIYADLSYCIDLISSSGSDRLHGEMTSIGISIVF